MSRFAASLRLAALPGFFALKVASGLLLLKLSSAFLGVTGFAIFSQLLLFSALVNMVAVAGAQNGLVRQIAAARDLAQRGAMRDGALLLWAGAALLVGVPVTLLAVPIADLLTGDRALWSAVTGVVWLSLAGGAGQIWGAILTGRGRAPISLVAQALGLLAGTAAASLLILGGQDIGAVLAFAAGPLVTAAIAGRAIRAEALPPPALSAARPEALALLRFGGAFVLVAAFTAIGLFLMRGYYQDRFGLESLGYWLTANRISDTSTQLMALYVLQYFVPRYTALVADPVADRARQSAILIRGWLVALAIMSGFLLVVVIAPALFVRIFLSPAFLPAIPVILAYMAGDVLRVWATMAMQASFARGRLLRYVGIEVGTILLMAAILLPLAAGGRADAPAIAYPAAYGITALLVTLAFVLRTVRLRRDPAPAAPPS